MLPSARGASKPNQTPQAQHPPSASTSASAASLSNTTVSSSSSASAHSSPFQQLVSSSSQPQPPTTKPLSASMTNQVCSPSRSCHVMSCHICHLNVACFVQLNTPLGHTCRSASLPRPSHYFSPFSCMTTRLTGVHHCFTLSTILFSLSLCSPALSSLLTPTYPHSVLCFLSLLSLPTHLFAPRSISDLFSHSSFFRLHRPQFQYVPTVAAL